MAERTFGSRGGGSRRRFDGCMSFHLRHQQQSQQSRRAPHRDTLGMDHGANRRNGYGSFRGEGGRDPNSRVHGQHQQRNRNYDAKPPNGVCFNGDRGVHDTTSQAQRQQQQQQQQQRHQDGADVSRLEGLYPEENIKTVLTWKESMCVGRVGPGLRNLGNTCFLNATLQCLSYVPPLAQHLLGTSYSPLFPATLEGDINGVAGMPGAGHARVPGKFDALLDMQHLIKKVLSPSVHGEGDASLATIVPGSFVDNISSIGKSFHRGEQGDAHELLRQLLDGMAEGCLKRCPKDVVTGSDLAQTTAIHRIFGGYIRDQLKCLSCGHRRDKYEPFLDLSLQLEEGVESLDEALKRFTAVEHMNDKDNLWECSGCHHNVCAEKRVSVYKPPNALVVHLKRAVKHRYKAAEKITRHIGFSDKLQLEVSGPEGSAPYVLTGVVVHKGQSMSSGHYYAYVRSAAGQWQMMNDESVTTVDVETVLNDRAYLLLYSKTLPSSPPPSQPLVNPAVGMGDTGGCEEEAAAADTAATAEKEPVVPSPDGTRSMSGGDVNSKPPVHDGDGAGAAGGSEIAAGTGGITSHAPSLANPARQVSGCALAHAGNATQQHKRKRSDTVNGDIAGQSVPSDDIEDLRGGKKVRVAGVAVGAGVEQSASAGGLVKRDGRNGDGGEANGDERQTSDHQTSKAGTKRKREDVMTEEDGTSADSAGDAQATSIAGDEEGAPNKKFKTKREKEFTLKSSSSASPELIFPEFSAELSPPELAFSPSVYDVDKETTVVAADRTQREIGGLNAYLDLKPT